MLLVVLSQCERPCSEDRGSELFSVSLEDGASLMTYDLAGNDEMEMSSKAVGGFVHANPFHNRAALQ